MMEHVQHSGVRTVIGLVATAMAPFLFRAEAAQTAGAAEPDREALAAAGRATIKRLETNPAAWTASTQIPGDTRLIAEVQGTAAMRRTVLNIEGSGGRTELIRLIVRDGLWYAAEGQKAARYRPYEVPFDLPTAYFFLARSDLQCFVDAKGGEPGIYEGTKDGVATYRTPLAASLRAQLENLSRQIREAQQKTPKQEARPGTAQVMEQIQDLMAHGTPTRINLASGVFVQYGAVDRQTTIRQFRWLDRIPPEAVEVAGTKWDDFTADPTAGGASDLMMISHNAMWKLGMKSADTDGRLLDLKTGKQRRVPYHGTMVLPGCFLKDRTRVAISGFDSLDGSVRLVEVNLKNGDNRVLGGDLLASGVSLMPAVSPDGQTLAVLHKGAGEGALETQLCLVDVETGKARTVGPPRDQANLSWLPGGKALLVMIRESTDPANLTAPRTETMARVELETGAIHRIGEGTSPVLLADGATILYLDAKKQGWRTCDLDGGNTKEFRGGLPGHGFPSPAPDGQRIVMMRFHPQQAPEPLVLPIGEGEAKPAIIAPGLWANPSWR